MSPHRRLKNSQKYTHTHTQYPVKMDYGHRGRPSPKNDEITVGETKKKKKEKGLLWGSQKKVYVIKTRLLWDGLRTYGLAATSWIV